MLEKKYFIGLDVHKRQTTFTVKDWDGITVEKGMVATDYSEIDDRLSKYLKTGEIVMEACTHYYPLYKKMKEKNLDVHVANVIQIRKLVGKNDDLDSGRLADMKRLNTLPESYIPDDKLQKLRSWVNFYHGLVQDRVSYKNQITANLDLKGIRFPVRNKYTKKGFGMLKKYSEDSDDFIIKTLISMLESCRERAKVMSAEIMKYLVENYKQDYELLKSIPGVGDIIAGYLVAEIGPIERFESKKKLRRYAGVVPVSDSSDGKIYSNHIPKYASRSKLRYAFVLAANSAVKVRCRLKEYYLKKRNGKKKNHGKAIMCVASSISDITYNVLKTKQPYKLHDQ